MRSPTALVLLGLLAAASPSWAGGEERSLTACEAAQLASRTLPWSYRVADGLRCEAPDTWNVPDREEPWLEWQAAQKGLLVVEKVDETVLEVVEPALAEAVGRLKVACDYGHLKLPDGKRVPKQPPAALRVAIDGRGEVRWVDAPGVLTPAAHRCLVKAIDAKKLKLLPRGGLPTLYRFAFGPVARVAGARSFKVSSQVGGLAKVGRALSERDIEAALLGRPFAVVGCLNDATMRWDEVTLSFPLDAKGRPSGFETVHGAAPAAVTRCLERELKELRFATGPDAKGRAGRYTFRRMHAFGYGGVAAYRPGRPRPVQEMTVCEAAQRATVQSGWSYEVAPDVDCKKTQLFRPAHPLSESGQWLDEQAVALGLLAVETGAGTRIENAPPSLAKLRSEVRRCDFGRVRLSGSKREVPRLPPLMLKVQVKKDGKLGWIDGLGDVLPDATQSCIRAAFTQTGVELEPRGGTSVYRLLMSSRPVELIVGAELDPDLRVPDEAGAHVARLQLDHTRVHRVIRSNHDRLGQCFFRDSAGIVDGVNVREVRLRWTIEGDGSVSDVATVYDGGSEAVSSCLKDKVAGLTFDLPDGTKRYWAVYTFLGVSLGVAGVEDGIDY